MAHRHIIIGDVQFILQASILNPQDSLAQSVELLVRKIPFDGVHKEGAENHVVFDVAPAGNNPINGQGFRKVSTLPHTMCPRPDPLPCRSTSLLGCGTGRPTNPHQGRTGAGLSSVSVFCTPRGGVGSTTGKPCRHLRPSTVVSKRHVSGGRGHGSFRDAPSWRLCDSRGNSHGQVRHRPLGRMMQTRTLYLCRGLPGSGKSAVARALAAYHCYAADDWFERDGGYDFDQTQLKDAHGWCQERVEADMKADVLYIAVHNTFSKAWEAKFYYELAEQYGYSVFVVEAQSEFGNVHGVPEAVVEKMRDRWEPLNRPLASLRHVVCTRLGFKFREAKFQLRKTLQFWK